MDVATIVTLAMTVIATVAGGFWLKAKGKLTQVKNVFKEGADVVITAVEAVDDNTLTQEEIEAIKKEAKEVLDAWKVLIGKA